MNVIALVVFFGFFSHISALGQAHPFRWLLGTWGIEGKHVYETWVEKDGALTGKGFRIVGRDTTVTEEMAIKFVDGSFQLISDVAGDQPPIAFKITSSGSASFVAENPQHDFPKIIRYQYVQHKDGALMEATIEGDGRKISYRFRRLK